MIATLENFPVTLRQVAQHHRGRPEAPQQGPGGRTDAEGERRLTDMPSDDRVVEHDRSGLEEGDLLRVGAPLCPRRRAARSLRMLARELQEAPHTPITRALADVLHDESHRGA